MISRAPRARIAVVALAVVGAILVASASAAQFQRRGGRFFNFNPENPPYDGAFQFCRIMFRNAANGDGGGWNVDWPRADQNLSYRFSELTTTSVSSDGKGGFNSILIRLTDEQTLAHCPFIMMTEPGGAYLDEAEANALKVYLQKGGFLWADDSWGEYAWEHWMNEIRKALPSGDYPVQDVPLDDALFHMLYDVREIPQIPSIGAWGGPGGRTWERVDAKVPHVRAIMDRNGHVLVLNTHNTDFGDAFEREGFSRAYFDTFAGPGYAFGINALLYAMTH
jgi:Domain of unknown function (DUF4159)